MIRASESITMNQRKSIAMNTGNDENEEVIKVITVCAFRFSNCWLY